MTNRTLKSLGFPLMLAALAFGVFGSLWVYMGTLERRALNSPAIRDQLLADGHIRPLAEVARTVAKMELVTAEVQTTVSTHIAHENWRGIATASVEAPARLLYGVDLSTVNVQDVGFSPATSAYIMRIPPPRRIATEVCGGDETFNVQVGWARLRSIAGEYYLGLARKSLYDRAREMMLSPEDARIVRETTMKQVEAAVRRLVGGSAPVTVLFDDRASAVAEARPEGEP